MARLLYPLRHARMPSVCTVLAICFVACFKFCDFACAEAPTTFTYRSAESGSDTRYNYDRIILDLALERTRLIYGPYELVASPPMTSPRAVMSIARNEYPNFFVKLSYQERYTAMPMIFARFPVDLGIVGYRVCFTNPAAQDRLKEVKTIDDLRQFTHGQGSGWADVQILRSNGFNVIEVASYDNLFKMVSAGRFDLFCRGANEVLDETIANRKVENLRLDETFAIVYPLPRFYYTHSSNRVAAQRVEEGLRLAYRDGSLRQAWEANFGKSIEFSHLDRRRIIRLENFGLSQLDFDFERYFYDALSDGRRNTRHSPPNIKAVPTPPSRRR